MKVLEKQLDPEGRLLLPKEWREKHGKKVLIVETDEYLKIVPKKARKLTDFFDSVEVDIKSDLTDWHAVKKELYSKRWPK
ncbi:MAG: AbrB/MazE/SpoVT family DNA-binding domain-containing protein [Candidatus Aenigmarchaeota archaeon]|nr:AbrB/MazE/SpoVT family DNA-binding domain-containing protein [Candidatus Aenigmarchaeota archaeon]